MSRARSMARRLPTLNKEQRALLLVIGALLMITFFAYANQNSFVSSEVRFTETSPSGLAIVPASCPSYAHTDGECMTANLTADNSEGPLTVPAGTVVRLRWVSAGGSSYCTGTNFNTGLAITGARDVTVNANTTYTLTCYPLGAWPPPSIQDSVTVNVGSPPPPPGDICTDIPGTQNSVPSGCQTPNPSPGACIPSGFVWNGSACVPSSPPPPPPPPPPAEPEIESFYSDPGRVRKNTATELHWNVENPPASCTISSNNGFGASVSGAIGSIPTNNITQTTTFTLTCGSDSATATVGILPNYQEI